MEESMSPHGAGCVHNTADPSEAPQPRAPAPHATVCAPLRHGTTPVELAAPCMRRVRPVRRIYLYILSEILFPRGHRRSCRDNLRRTHPRWVHHNLARRPHSQTVEDRKRQCPRLPSLEVPVHWVEVSRQRQYTPSREPHVRPSRSDVEGAKGSHAVEVEHSADGLLSRSRLVHEHSLPRHLGAWPGATRGARDRMARHPSTSHGRRAAQYHDDHAGRAPSRPSGHSSRDVGVVAHLPKHPPSSAPCPHGTGSWAGSLAMATVAHRLWSVMWTKRFPCLAIYTSVEILVDKHPVLGFGEPPGAPRRSPAAAGPSTPCQSGRRPGQQVRKTSTARISSVITASGQHGDPNGIANDSIPRSDRRMVTCGSHGHQSCPGSPPPRSPCRRPAWSPADRTVRSPDAGVRPPGQRHVDRCPGDAKAGFRCSSPSGPPVLP